MARIRSIKPTFFTSLTITQLPRDARLTFAGLWTYVDDEGRGIDDARLIKAALWPLDEDVTPAVVAAHLVAAERLGLVIRYAVAGRNYLAVRNFREHQKISKPQASKFPPPPSDEHRDAPEPSDDESPFPPDDSRNVPGTFAEDSRNVPSGKGKEGKGKEGGIAAGAAPESSRNGSHPAAVSLVPPTAPASAPAELPAWLVLHAEWETRIGPVDKGRFRKAFRPIAEPDGGRDLPAPLPILRRAIERCAARKRKTREWDFLKPETFVAGFREHLDVARMAADDFVKLLPLPAGAA